MLKPIHRVNCGRALAACQRLMQQFALWLCDPNVRGTTLTRQSLLDHMPSAIEGEWLWTLIAVDRRSTKRTKALLDAAKLLADLPTREKLGLAHWVQAVAKVADHFTAAPPANLRVGPPNDWKARSRPWQAFQSVMAAFYEEGLKKGLPYQSDGTPTTDAAQQVSYETFATEFRRLHRLDPHPYAREVCVLCGGELTGPQVDHWACQSMFPLLAVCADNLLPVCDRCNGPSHKGQRPVHTAGSFQDWFHPYLRHANGALRLLPITSPLSIRAESHEAEHAGKVRNLDQLIDLSERWTREFKAEVQKIRREISPAERLKLGLPELNPQQLLDELMTYRNRLSPKEPNYEVHRAAADFMLDEFRRQSLLK
jgi:hypothetical protein